MLLLITFIITAITIIAFVLYTKGQYSYWEKPNKKDNPFGYWCYQNTDVTGTVSTVGITLIILLLIAMLIVGICYSKHSVIDEKITMYQEENTDIEQKIASAILSYQDYEQETFSNVDTENLIIAVSLYPELKSDQLVSKLIDTYTENNKTIKELKDKKLDYKVLKWWLCFG